MEQMECSETSAYKLQMPGNYPKESIQHTEHGESLKSRIPVITDGSVSRATICGATNMLVEKGTYTFTAILTAWCYFT